MRQTANAANAMSITTMPTVDGPIVPASTWATIEPSTSRTERKRLACSTGTE